MARRARATWTTVETCGNYEFQKNNYEEVRIKSFGRVFRTFNGQNAHADARRYWKTINKVVNGEF